MAQVVLLVHPERPEAGRIARDAAAMLTARGDKVRTVTLSDQNEAVEEEGVRSPLRSLDLATADLAVSLGGDGTFLRLVALCAPAGVPLLGVNFGRLGYLLDTAPDQAVEAILAFLERRTALESRTLLEVEIVPPDDGHRQRGLTSTQERTSASATASSERSWLALNEAVLEKTVPGHTVQLCVLVDGEGLATHRADGVIVATPTGSTAYNLSAGGPLVASDLQALVVTPVAPHLTNPASVVLEATRTVGIRVDEIRPAVLVIDGQPVGRLEPGWAVSCRVAKDAVQIVSFGRRNLVAAFRSVLGPGPQLR